MSEAKMYFLKFLKTQFTFEKFFRHSSFYLLQHYLSIGLFEGLM